MLSDMSLDVRIIEAGKEQSAMDEVKQNFLQHKELLKTYALIFFIAAIVGSFILWLGFNPLVRIVQLMAFIGVGYMYIRSLQTSLSFLAGRSQIIYSGLMFVLILIASAIGHFIMGISSVWLTLTTSLSFLVPYSLYLSWHAFEEIPDTPPPLWFYSESPEMKQGVVSLHTMPIKVMVEERPYHTTKKMISFSAPGRMKLGTVLYNILREQNADGAPGIPYMDDEKNVFGWGFQKSTIGIYHTWLNPELSLIENNIKPNNVIIARRMINNEQPVMKIPT